MARNSIKSLVIVGSLFLALLLGVSAWFSWREAEKRRKAFALHEHEKRDPVQQPCLVLKEDSSTKGTHRAAIHDCLLLGPEGSELDVVEVDLRYGLFVLARTDLFIPGDTPIALTRAYRPRESRSWAFGLSSDVTQSLLLAGDSGPYTYLDLGFIDGTTVHFDRTSPGVSYADAVYEHQSLGSPYQGSRIKWNGNGWKLDRRDGWQYLFPDGCCIQRPAQAALVGLRTPGGKVVTMSRDVSGDLKRIESADGRWINLEYEGHKVAQATDSLGRSVRYAYDAQSRLIKIQEAKEVTELFYDDSHYLLRVIKNKKLAFRCEYDSEGRIAALTLGDGSVYRMHYKGSWRDGEGYVETKVTAPNGEVAVVSSSRTGYTVRDWSLQ